ncbi:MAG TPA: enhanced serine sensitivity protein SseB C-terminal domain-containing protein [Rhizomicrobium sp.]|nr:enhanced serine sensitivity protein SseB C-terminal domain-containing protein [Rhizomicrobium sp.]
MPLPFIAENELERALIKAVKNPQTAPDFYRLLLACDLLVLGTVEGQEDAAEKFTLAPGGKFNLVTGLKDGRQFLPLFSSQPRMQEYLKQESKYLSVNGRALLDMTRGGPVILNPASEYGKELSVAEVAQLLDGPKPDGEPRTIIGEADYPVALVEALRSLFGSRTGIAAAWMIQVTFADRAKLPHPLVGIELDSKTGDDWPSLMQAIEAAADVAVPGMVFDIQRVDRRSPAGMTGALLQVPPFYQRRASIPGGPTLN